MKKKITAILLTLALLAGCQSQAPASPPAADTLDMEAIIQQSVDEAVREKMEQFEEEQRKKDEEIAWLKDRLEDLTSQPEVPPEEGDREEPPATESQPETASSLADDPALESQPQEVAPSQPELPPQPEPEPASPQSTSFYDPFDLKNMYPDYVWEGMEEAEEESYTAGCLPEEAEEAIRLANQERENHGLDPLPTDSDLMELAEIRAEEIRESYSHTRPDGTNVGVYRCGENCGQRSSAPEQVKSWMNSEGHRTNILLERYHHIGAACYQAENGNLYWVQVFSLD